MLRIRRMNRVIVTILLLSGSACGPTLAHLAQPPEVASCTPIGETTVDSTQTLNVDRVTALRQKAAAAGATDVVSEGSDGVKGKMYKCQSNTLGDETAHNRGGF